MKRNYFQIGDDLELKPTELKFKDKKKSKEKSVPAWMLNIGFYIITPLLLGLVIGLYLDNLFHTKKIFTLALIFLGFISTIYNLLRLVKDVH